MKTGQQKFLATSSGFSLTELMVVFVIVGILATMGIPRLRVFIAQARQGEAKVNIGEISKLQHLYMSARDKYLAMGVAPTGNKAGSGGIGYDNSTDGSETRNCKTAEMAKLGFRPDGCVNFRYSYWVVTKESNGVDRFIVGAYGPSDDVARIFPTCDGSKQEGTTTARVTQVLDHKESTAHADLHIDTMLNGDTWMIDDTRRVQSDNIVTVCTGADKKGENTSS